MRRSRKDSTSRVCEMSALDRGRSTTVSIPSSRRRPFSALCLVGLAASTILTPGCHEELDTERVLPARASVGEEMFGVICDRVGAQALREDLTGDSFRKVCHRPVGGVFEDKVDATQLPEINPAAINESGQPVSVEDQTKNRAKAVGRVEALARRRAELIRAFDATFPQEKVAIKDIDNPDETKSCGAPAQGAEGLLADQIAEMLGKMGELYNDGTLPQSTQSLARVVETFEKSQEAQSAWARLSSRQGYRPIETALGVTRPVVAYPNLRDLSNTSLRLLSADSNPYELNPKRDALGNRIPVPGAGNAALNKVLEVAHHELLNSKADPRPAVLVAKARDAAGRIEISRPRDNLEMMQEILFKTDDAFGGGSPRYIVRRDSRGYAAIATTLPFSFVDADKDGLPDVDDMGRFRTADGVFTPSPFPYSGTIDDTKRDPAGRALLGDKLVYEYVDTSRAFAARLLEDLKPLVNPDPAANHETLMDLSAGLYVSLGQRAKTEKKFASGTVSYDGISPNAPILDLIYASGVILGDKSADGTLRMARDLFADHPKEIARITGALLQALEIAKKHDEAKIPRETTFWDDALEITAKIAKNPELLKSILIELGNPESEKLGTVLSKHVSFKDRITYDKNDLNGAPWNATTKSKSEMVTPVDRAAPITGQNRSALHRVLQLLSDTKGVTVCNKAGARLYALKGSIEIIMPISFPPGSGSYPECGVFKLDDLARFYVQTIGDAYHVRVGDPADKIPPGAIYVRNEQVREGLIGDLGAATVETMEHSSGIHGFWTPPDSRILAAKPQWLNRLSYFDFDGDDVNAQTRKHVDGLTGRYLPTALCPEKIIDDPEPTAPDAFPDGKIRVRSCAEGQNFQQRNDNTLFLLEEFGFYEAVRPLVRAFVKHKAEDLFLEFAKVAYKYYPNASASEVECQLPAGNKCTRQGLGSYEALLAEQLVTDLLPALSQLSRTLGSMCYEPGDGGTCKVSAIDYVVEATRAALDPDYAKDTLKLTDRHGSAATKKNDGSPVAQVTPAYLITNALNAIDAAFDAHEAQHPDDKGLRANYRRARSQLVDQFMTVTGTKETSAFQNPTMTKMTPVILDLLRSQLNVRCPKSFAPPYEKCTWARDELPKKATETLTGPLASTGLEVMEIVRRDPEARRQTEILLQYLLDGGSNNDALASMLASTSDLVQLLRDEENLVPLFHVMAAAVDASVKDPQGNVVQKSLIDAQMALLARLSGRYYDAAGKEICKREIDPNQVLTIALGKLVTPIKDGDFKGQSPLEVIIDVVADVNRVDPTQPYAGTLSKDDYGSVSNNVVDFLINKERGLEQFYEVIRQGTKF